VHDQRKIPEAVRETALGEIRKALHTVFAPGANTWCKRLGQPAPQDRVECLGDAARQLEHGQILMSATAQGYHARTAETLDFITLLAGSDDGDATEEIGAMVDLLKKSRSRFK
jgi:hypothetical protein